jgi:hypothetical protein
MPYPDVVGIEANEDTVVIAASVFGKPKGN